MAWAQLWRQQRVGLKQPLSEPFDRRRQERNTQHDEERKLEARLKQLLGIPQQNDESGGSQ